MAVKSIASSPPSLALVSLLCLSLHGAAFAPPLARLASPPGTSPSPLPSTAATDLGATAVDGEADEARMYVMARDLLSRDEIRAQIIRQEETIIFSLIERAQYRRNDVVYEAGGVPDLGVPAESVLSEEEAEGEMSFLDFMLTGTEVIHGIVGRYDSPEEYAFFPGRLPKSCTDRIAKNSAGRGLNWNKVLYDKYLNVIVPAITEEGDDEQYGSTVISDIAALQALSKKIHYGKFTAESSYQMHPAQFQRMVDEGDADGVRKLLTNAKAEQKAGMRVRLKATTYGREPMLSRPPKIEGDDADRFTAVIASAVASAVVSSVEAVKETDGSKIKGKVDPSVAERIHRQVVLPMTMDVQVAYTFFRCGKQPPALYAGDRMSMDVTEVV